LVAFGIGNEVGHVLFLSYQTLQVQGYCPVFQLTAAVKGRAGFARRSEPLDGEDENPRIEMEKMARCLFLSIFSYWEERLVWRSRN
jgi:hypothetical protein